MIWIVIFALALIAEAFTAAVVSIWFAVGAVAAFIADLCGAALWIEILLFLGVSAVTLLFVRPFYRRFGKTHLTPTNNGAMIGKTALVSSAIQNAEGKGSVKLNGLEYAARSTNGIPIDLGEIVVVDRIEGVRLFVTRLADAPEAVTGEGL